MNKNPGGKQAKMRSITWKFYVVDQKQSLVFQRRTKVNGSWFKRGEPKGLLRIARERVELGAKIRNLEFLKRDELINKLSEFEDFRNVKSKLLELIENLNKTLFNGEKRITAEFLPKYHCELAEIEMWWRNAKYSFRKENDRNWKTITPRVNRALDQFGVPYFSKLFRQVKAIEMAYGDGHTAEELLQLKETNIPPILESLAVKPKSNRGATSLLKENSWKFITLNEITPRVYISI